MNGLVSVLMSKIKTDIFLYFKGVVILSEVLVKHYNSNPEYELIYLVGLIPITMLTERQSLSVLLIVC